MVYWTDLDYKLKLRRYEFIVACAYYIQLKGDNGDLDRLVMTTELAELITERYKTTDMHWAVADFKYYEQLLDAGLNESRNLSTVSEDFAIVIRFLM